MSWNIKTPGDYINGPLTVAGTATITGNVGIGTTSFTSISGYTSLKINNASNGAIIDLAKADAYIGRLVANSSGFSLESAGTNPINFQVGGLNSFSLFPSGVFTWYDGAGGTRMTLNSIGLGIGVSPSAKLHVGGAPAATTGSLIYLRDTTANGSNNSLGSIFFSSNPGTDFYVGKKSTSAVGSFSIGTGAGVELLGINGNGIVALQGGNISANGVGIAFPAAQSASTDANTLDDYEEGTFTPTVKSGMTGVTYSDQNGRYVKIGRLVTFYIRLLTSGGTRDGGHTILTGLPFNVGTGNGVAMIEYNNSGFQSGASDATPRFYLPGGFSDLELYNSNGSAFVGNQLGASSFDLRIFGHYYVS